MDIFDRAIIFAVKAHEGQTRKSGGAYIIHPMETATIAATMTDDRELLAASVLHDTVEDTKVRAEDIEREFGERVAFLVASETEDKRRDVPPQESWHLRKEESLRVLENAADMNIKILWLSDKLSNMRSFYRVYKAEGNSLWSHFNQPDPEQQYWYYRTIAENTAQLSDTSAWKEYCDLINKIFCKDKSDESGRKI